MLEHAEHGALSTAPRFPIVRRDPQNEWEFNEEIGLFLTRRCPLRCAHCIVSADPSYDDPDEESVLRIVRSIAADRRLKHVSITGGEPFLRLDLLGRCLSILRAAGKRASFHLQSGVGHAFMNDARPDCHDAAAAAEGWDRMLAFLRAELT